ncbi:hypothetical protein L210DRAFT_3535884 [Boletus edulis BED1]|uniref:Protein-S-isoprenylcysteine O-methyltransferase n=1 Tax=Boletus edulis BED1 TaxID=1328754 RepID=A0AAD4BX55_BOLED|nr:hypothetical protein L210DRAFT_3535884 [Boletus edulis BED1]
MFSSTQLLELFIVLCIADLFRYASFTVRSSLIHAQAKSGPVRPDSTPTRLSVLISPLQGFVFFLVPTTYVLSVVCTGFHQPQWMNALALPEVVFGVRLEGTWKNALRVLACFARLPLRKMSESIFEHLGDQYHLIGRREKPRVVQTGPYALVRHPLYTVALFQVALQCLMFWSYVPLFALVATAAIIAIKIPIEEEAIQRDAATREEYRAYMRKVPARLVPYVW